VIDRLNGRLAALIAGAVFIAVLLVGWFAFVSPQRSKAAQLDSQIGSVNAEISSTQAYLRSPTTKGYAKELQRLKLAVPDNVQMSQILRQLSAAAKRAGVSITGITPGVLVPSAGGQAVPITVTVQGHYFRLGSFLHILRTLANVGSNNKVQVSGRLYSVDGIQFSTGTSGASGSVISASVSLDAFISTPAPAPPPTTTDTTTTP
jgi:Tfp pilus assembly protein PilO